MTKKHTLLSIIALFLFAVTMTAFTGCKKDESLIKGNLMYYQVDKYPIALAIGSDDIVWVACEEGQSVLEIASNGEILNTYALSSKPMDLAIDGSGQVWIPISNGNLLKLDPTTGNIDSFTISLSPKHITIDSYGNIWIGGDNMIKKVGANGNILATVNFNGSLHNMVIGPQNNVWLLINSYENEDKILEISTNGTILKTLINPTRAWDLSFDHDGYLLLYDIHGPRLVQLNSNGEINAELSFGNQSNGAGSMPRGIAIASDGTIWTVNSATITAISSELSGIVESYDNGNTTVSGIAMVPKAIAIDSKGNVWLAIANDWEATQSVEENTSIGRLTRVAHGPQFFPITGPVWP